MPFCTPLAAATLLSSTTPSRPWAGWSDTSKGMIFMTASSSCRACSAVVRACSAATRSRSAWALRSISPWLIQLPNSADSLTANPATTVVSSQKPSLLSKKADRRSSTPGGARVGSSSRRSWAR
ncbi:hypothetical protein [Ideonella sp. B508-1]|uniref:hypothetical protein n=1 Tax=Ideonella sp. B508-1 TaxID=137716 RepID=UPI0003B537F2|nr:hypothetical protein [Ideonella sp. B508-1]